MRTLPTLTPHATAYVVHVVNPLVHERLALLRAQRRIPGLIAELIGAGWAEHAARELADLVIAGELAK